MPTGIKMVVYDADNTLFNTVRSNIAQLSEVGRRVGAGDITEEQYWRVIVQPGDEMLRTLFPDHLAEAKAAYKEVGQYSELVSVEPGLVETLQTLADRGLRLGIATNRHEMSLRMIFERFPEVAEFFDRDLVFVLHDTRLAQSERRFRNTFAQSKPDPECLEVAMWFTGLSPRQIIYVGDTPNDQRTARSAGVHFVGYERCETEFGCITIHEHPQLLDLI
jgi:phosphoglycolate phosphatase-like HAD superfamily hydrolase